MKIINTYYEEDRSGKHKVQEQSNGVKIRFLVEPSQWYKDKMKKRSEVESKKRAEQEEKAAQEKLIKDRMREIAIRELKKEGKL